MNYLLLGWTFCAYGSMDIGLGIVRELALIGSSTVAELVIFSRMTSIVIRTGCSYRRTIHRTTKKARHASTACYLTVVTDALSAGMLNIKSGIRHGVHLPNVM